MSYRKLGVLVRRLPPESALAAAIRTDPQYDDGDTARDVEAELWSRSDHLDAALIEEVRQMRMHLAAVLGDRKAASTHLEPIERPGVEKKPKRDVDLVLLQTVLDLSDS